MSQIPLKMSCKDLMIESLFLYTSVAYYSISFVEIPLGNPQTNTWN